MRGMSDRIALILITVCPCRCDDTTLCVNHQPLPPWWMGDSTFPRRATGPQSSKAGRKGGQHRARRCHTTEQVAMDSESKGMFEASSWRTCSRWLTSAETDKGRPKRERSQAMQVQRCTASTRTEPGVKCRPTVTENGHTERSNPPTLSIRPSREPPICCWWEGWLKKQMPGVMSRIC